MDNDNTDALGEILINFNPMPGIAISMKVPAGAAHGDPVKLAGLATKTIGALIDGFKPVAQAAMEEAKQLQRGPLVQTPASYLA